MDAGLTQLEQQAQQQDEKTHQQPGQEHSFALLELPRDALVGILTAARDLDPYAKHNLKALACSCKHLNLLARTCVPFRLTCWRGDPVEHARMLITSQPPWAGCTRLEISAAEEAALGMLPGMLAAAAHWPNCCDMRLGLPLPKEEKVPLPPPPPQQQQQQQQDGQQQAQQQEGGWLQEEDEEEVEEAAAIVYTAEPTRYARQDLLTAGPLYSLRHLPQLHTLELSIDAFGHQTARALSTAAPQLTSLDLKARVTPWDHRAAGQTLCHPPSDWSSLSRLTNLKKLALRGALCVAPLPQQQPGAAADAVPFSSSSTSHTSPSSSSSSSSGGGGGCAVSSCLPVNVQEVVFEQVAILPYWLTHLAGCRQLRKLQIHLRGWRRYAADHPASVAAAVLQLAPGLVSLRFTGWREGGRVVWKAQPALLPAPAPVAAAAAAVVAGAGAGPGAAAEAPHVPRQWRPQGALLALTGLQELQADPNAVLVLRTAADWQGLALLGALTILENVRVCSAPPKGLALPSLQAILGVRLACPASATGQLLRALPKLCRLDITRCDSQALEGAERQGDAPHKDTQGQTEVGADLSNCLTCLTIDYRAGSHTAAAAAEHFTAAFAGATAVKRLALRWPASSDAAPHLPDLSFCYQLQYLEVTGCLGKDRTLEEDLLLMLRPPGVAASLRTLVLVHMPLVTPRAVLALQQELTALTKLTMHSCGKLQLPAVAATAAGAGAAQGASDLGVAVRSVQQQWALLKQLVLPRLTFRVDPNTMYELV